MRNHLNRWLKLPAFLCLTFLFSLALLTACGDPQLTAEHQAESTSPSDGEGALEAHLSALKEYVGEAEPVSVSLTITNKTSRAIRIPRVSTAVNGIRQPIFTVARDGVPVVYRGVIATPDGSKDAAYLTVNPGEAVTHTVDLASSYDFSAGGNYLITYGGSETQLQVVGRPFVTGAPNTKAISACDDEQRNRIYLSWGAARDSVNEVLDYLGEGAREDPRFRTWFGVPYDWKWDMIQERFAYMAGVFDRRDVACRTYSDANCDSTTLAYVQASVSEKIYLCPIFFDAGRPYSHGTDSNAGTFVHEMAHLSGVHQTPEVYDRAACKQLVLDDNWRARNNAQNYKFFADQP